MGGGHKYDWSLLGGGGGSCEFCCCQRGGHVEIEGEEHSLTRVFPSQEERAWEQGCPKFRCGNMCFKGRWYLTS